MQHVLSWHERGRLQEAGECMVGQSDISAADDRGASAGVSGVPVLGIDIDGCVDEATGFFRTLTQIWPGRVCVVSYRSNREKAVSDLARYGIRCDELFLVKSLDGKAEVIVREGISVFFDDQPECLRDIPATTHVLLMRNGGNFDFEQRKWVLSGRTGRLLQGGGQGDG